MVRFFGKESQKMAKEQKGFQKMSVKKPKVGKKPEDLKSTASEMSEPETGKGFAVKGGFRGK